jgi:hypothetical protein
MKQHPFHEIAKPAAFRISSPEITFEQPESKFLEDFIGGVQIAQQFAQIAADGISVPVKQLPAGRLLGPGGTVMRQVYKRPQGRNATEPVVRVLLLHALFSLVWRRSEKFGSPPVYCRAEP